MNFQVPLAVLRGHARLATTSSALSSFQRLVGLSSTRLSRIFLPCSYALFLWCLDPEISFSPNFSIQFRTIRVVAPINNSRNTVLPIKVGRGEAGTDLVVYLGKFTHSPSRLSVPIGGSGSQTGAISFTFFHSVLTMSDARFATVEPEQLN